MRNSEKFITGISIVILAIAIVSGCGRNLKKEPETVKIGVIVPLSGNSGVLGDYTLKGLQLAVDEQNSKGGLLKRTIELDIRDSKGDPEEGARMINAMMEQANKPFMVYSIISTVTLAVKPVTEANKIILMSAVGSDRFLEESNFTVRSFVAASTIGQELSRFLKDTLNISGLTVFYSDNDYGKSVNDAMVKHCNEKNINVISEPFDETLSDFTDLIAAGVDKDTECVFLAGIGTGLGILYKQIKESGYNGKIVGDPLMAYPDVEKAAGSALKGIQYLDFAFDPKSQDPNIQAFVNGFESKFNTLPQNFSVITYDGVKLLFSVIEEAGTLNADVLIEELNDVQDFQGVFGPLSVTDRNIVYRFAFKTWD